MEILRQQFPDLVRPERVQVDLIADRKLDGLLVVHPAIQAPEPVLGNRIHT